MTVATIRLELDSAEVLIEVDEEGWVYTRPIVGLYYDWPQNLRMLGCDDARAFAAALNRVAECWQVAWDARRARGFRGYGNWPTVDPEMLAVTWPDEVKP